MQGQLDLAKLALAQRREEGQGHAAVVVVMVVGVVGVSGGRVCGSDCLGQCRTRVHLEQPRVQSQRFKGPVGEDPGHPGVTGMDPWTPAWRTRVDPELL